MKHSGLTMLELTMATAISALTLVFLARSNQGMFAQMQMSFEVQRLAGDLPALRKEFAKFFSRSVGIGITPSGAVRSGMLVDGNGAFVLAADLRPCGTLDPTTSTEIENITEVRVMCCAPDFNMTVNLPTPPYPAGTTANLSSACKSKSGLSIQLSKGGVFSREVCYSDMDEFYMMESGVHRLRGETLYEMEFVAQFTRPKKTDVLKVHRFQLFDAVGGLNELNIACN